MEIISIIVIAILGLVIGSFFNVCIYRIPNDKSIVFPGSFCPECGKNIAWYDNIPVMSYLLLKGKCRHCNKSISIRYPLVELFTTLTFVGLFIKFDVSYMFFLFFVLFSLLIIIFFIDLEHMIIPDALTIPFTIIALLANLVYSVFVKKTSFLFFLKIYVAGFLCAGLIFLLIYFLAYLVYKKEAFGLGDVKLAFMLGAFIGILKTVPLILTSFIIGGIVAIILYIITMIKNFPKGKETNIRKKEIPFAPFLVVATYLMVFYGKFIFNIWRAYIDILEYILKV